jgi:hypothetical protein
MFPNWFNSVQEHFSNVPVEPLRVLQVGAYTGDATQWLLDNRDISYIHDVDTWGGSNEEVHNTIDFNKVEELYDSRFAGNDKVFKYKMTSDRFFQEVSGYTYNFIYIDGDHTALQTALDGLNAFKLLDSGGVMAFDDYQWSHGGSPFLEPKRGVDAFLHVCQDNYELIETGYQVWIKKN